MNLILVDRMPNLPTARLCRDPHQTTQTQDKDKVENAVQVIERWVLARLRYQQSFSLVDLNKAIADLLEDLNTRPFKKLPGSRRSAFEAIDKPALRPLPRTIFEMCTWKKAKVGVDYHVEMSITITVCHTNMPAKQSNCAIAPACLRFCVMANVCCPPKGDAQRLQPWPVFSNHCARAYAQSTSSASRVESAAPTELG